MLPAAFGVSVSQISLVLELRSASFLITAASVALLRGPADGASGGGPGAAVGNYPASQPVEVPRVRERGRIQPPSGLGPAHYGAPRCPERRGAAVLALPLITMLFQYGRFGTEDALMTQRALIAYSVGLGARFS